ncbi:hypothetical protein MNV49_004973 [Pseudohyphozyma bogoriensis]|nr:hypothetical protein MNV49_004973 [Pseudohyphozyma bogoriensis]
MSSCGGPPPPDEDMPQTAPISRTCNRCSNPTVITVRVTPYCSDCFRDAYEFKLKKGFEYTRNWLSLRTVKGKEKGKQKERPCALLAYSGGVSSRVMLERFKSNFIDSIPPQTSPKWVPKGVFEKAVVVWVDHSGVPGFVAKEGEDEASVRRVVDSLGFELLVVPLSSPGTLRKEVVFYAALRGWVEKKEVEEGVDQEGQVSVPKEVKAKGKSIGVLVDDFIDGLEVNFPDTASTIYRTVGKLGMRSEGEPVQDDDARCPLCCLPSQSGAGAWRSSITLSSFSQPAPSSFAPSPSSDSPSALSSHADPLSKDSLTSTLCYGCLLILQDAPTGSDASDFVWPSYLQKGVEKRWKRMEEGRGVGEENGGGTGDLRKVVEEFLLVDDA